MIMRLAVFVQCQLVSDKQPDGQTDGQTHDDIIYRASIASRSKKRISCRRESQSDCVELCSI